MTARNDATDLKITPQLLLKAYACGIFPMAESAQSTQLHWIEPTWRGVIPLTHFHVPRRLRRSVRSEQFKIRVNSDFDSVIAGCAAPAPGRRKTWINTEIRRLCEELFRGGNCHTVEAWREGCLVGGLYGISLGGAFFGESMFSRETNASKVALVHLVARLIAGNFQLLDTQFVTEHLSGFGAIEVAKHDYAMLLDNAIECEAAFHALPHTATGADVLATIDHAAAHTIGALPPRRRYAADTSSSDEH